MKHDFEKKQSETKSFDNIKEVEIFILYAIAKAKSNSPDLLS